MTYDKLFLVICLVDNEVRLYATINGVSKLLSPTPKLFVFAHLDKELLVKPAIWFAVVPSGCAHS